MLKRYDAIYLLDSWSVSEGAREEYREAIRLGMEVFHEWKYCRKS